MKKKQYDVLIDQLSVCTRCVNMKKRNGTDCSLINVYKDQTFCKNIPSIWTDWYRRLDAEIMVIGQDWGPYSDMQKFHDAYVVRPTQQNWNELIEQEKSLTKKMFTKYFVQAAHQYGISIDPSYIQKIFITNAIMCARQGDDYRSDSIKLKDCTLNCMGFLEKQIDIVKPKIILTLGYYPLYSLSKIFQFEIEKTLTKTIGKNRAFYHENIVVIPLYHPSAQVSKEKQLQQYQLIWEHFLSDRGSKNIDFD